MLSRYLTVFCGYLCYLWRNQSAQLLLTFFTFISAVAWQHLELNLCSLHLLSIRRQIDECVVHREQELTLILKLIFW